MSAQTLKEKIDGIFFQKIKMLDSIYIKNGTGKI
jgi:hypothetical protein